MRLHKSVPYEHSRPDASQRDHDAGMAQAEGAAACGPGGDTGEKQGKQPREPGTQREWGMIRNATRLTASAGVGRCDVTLRCLGWGCDFFIETLLSCPGISKGLMIIITGWLFFWLGLGFLVFFA